MSNPYVRKVTYIAFVLSIIYSISLIADVYLTTTETLSMEHVRIDNADSVVVHSNYEEVEEKIRTIQIWGDPIMLFASITNNLGIAFIYGMLISIAGPILAFLEWFAIFYIISLIYAKLFKRPNSEPVPNKPVSKTIGKMISILIGVCILQYVIIVYAETRQFANLQLEADTTY
ncbi:MAG: hypothetical protein M1459_02395 [Patescibacteria group bacterium]|nr:hypothetical protein [Patescibacteria group bacterium]